MKDDSGSIYYYNESTGATQWDPPDEYTENSSKSNLNAAVISDNQEWVCFVLVSDILILADYVKL